MGVGCIVDMGVDEFVQDNGPYRNHDIVAFNGPDMRFFTLEDTFGDSHDAPPGQSPSAPP